MSAPAALLPLAIAVPLLAGTTIAAAGRLLPRLGRDIFTGVAAAAELALLAVLFVRTGDGRTVDWQGGWQPSHGQSVGIVLVGDRLGIGLALLTSVLVLGAVAYSWHYFEEQPEAGHGGVFPGLLLLFEAGMVGFALTGDLFDAFVFFELMGAVAYALTGYRIEDPRPLHGALTFGVINSLAAYCSLLGIGLLYGRTGQLGFAQIGRALDGRKPDALVVCAFVLVLAGPLTKAATVPIHFWLPDAHAVAPTPVCMLLSGVMVELGLYGVARIYWVVFSGPGGVPASAFRSVMLALGVLTALLGALMCWQQRHLKRLLAFSTIAHVGLFLTGVALLDAASLAGTAVYLTGHALAKAALFGLVGVLLDRYGSVDEHDLFGRARELRLPAVLFAVGGLALAGLPPFATALGKGLAEDAAGRQLPWLPAVFVVVSAATGGAVLRAGLRVFHGAGLRPREHPDVPETRGEGEQPEVRSPGRRLPRTLTAVPASMLACCLAVGLLPAGAVASAATVFTDAPGYRAETLGLPRSAVPTLAVPESAWTVGGVLLGVCSVLLALAFAAAALFAPALELHSATFQNVARPVRRAVLTVRRLHSGRLGDYVVWLLVGLAVLLAAFGMLGPGGA